jgi:hypothetical protein
MCKKFIAQGITVSPNLIRLLKYHKYVHTVYNIPIPYKNWYMSWPIPCVIYLFLIKIDIWADQVFSRFKQKFIDIVRFRTNLVRNCCNGALTVITTKECNLYHTSFFAREPGRVRAEGDNLRGDHYELLSYRSIPLGR